MKSLRSKSTKAFPFLLSALALAVGITAIGCSDNDDKTTTAPNTSQRQQSVAQIIAGTSQLSTLNSALAATNLDSVLNTTGPFTVFAPTDSAFAKLPAGLLDTLLAHPDSLLRPLLLYHVASGALTTTQIADSTQITTLQGSPISVSVVNGKVVLNNTAQLTTTDIIASNGIVHIINAVLIPPAR